MTKGRSHSLNGKNGHSAVQPIKRKVGRPSLLNNRIATVICGRLAQGKSLREICKSPRLPSATTIRDWIVKNPEFAARYEIARQLQADYWAEEIIAIADDGSNDTYEDKDGNTCTDGDVIQRSRLRVDARKWIVGKLHPRAYGERPAEVNTNVNVHNYLISPEKLKSIRERHAKALQSYAR